jgi:ABC-type molybdate transport system substrate-binding protein
MLDPNIRVGTSTPLADPSGDYAMEVFARADEVERGAADRLRAKAVPLTGGKAAGKPTGGRSVYSEIMANGDADIFLTYVNNAAAVLREIPGVALVELPPELAVTAEYGLVVLSDRKLATAIADWILSLAGQDTLVRHGFQPAA